MDKFKQFYKRVMPFSTGFGVLGVLTGIPIAIYLFSMQLKDKSDLAPCMCCFFDLNLTAFLLAANVLLSLIALNRESFQDLDDKRFARKILWLNLFLLPGLFVLIWLTGGQIAQKYAP